MTTTKQFEKICSHQGSNFKKWFGDMPFVKGKEITTYKTLERSMNDKDIMDTFHPEPVTIEDVYATLKTLDHQVWGIFYVKDSAGVLRAVYVFWGGGGWRVGADSVGFPYGWRDGYRVFSRHFSDSQTSSSYTLSLGAPCPHCGELVRVGFSK